MMRKFIMGLAGFVAVAAVRAEPASPRVNAATIYGPLMSNIAAWAAAHTNISLTATNNFAGPDAEAAYKELLPQVNALGAANDATFCDWGTKFEDGVAALVPYINPAMKAARAAQWVAAYEAENGLPQFGDHALEAMRVARNCGEDRLLISMLVQIANEKKALDFLRANVGKLDAAGLDALDRKLAALPPGTTSVEAMQFEKAMLVDNLIRQVMEAMREADTNLFELVGTADGVGAGGSVSNGVGAASSARSWLADNLRLTSIVESGGRMKIGFEMKDGESFVVALGRPYGGIEMLSVDYTREEAVIARSNETAIVRLKSREIAPMHLRLRLPDPRHVATGADSGTSKHRAVQDLVRAMSSFGDGDGSTSNMLFAAAGGTADGLLHLLQKTSEDYGEWIAAFQRLPIAGFRDWQDEFLKRASPLTRQLLPAVDKIAEKEKLMLESRAKLADAINSRRAALRRK